ncbi:MAG: PAS domain-containing sensor histidine kinase, partial [Caulobacteraceae bacterium]
MTDDLLFLDGGGTASELVRARDWSTSPLGPPQDWPQSLRSVVGLMLNSNFPMFVAWGPELGFLYNDAYSPILGGKHPAALGNRFQDIWSEIWPDILPLIETAMAGQASYRENLPLTMRRNGYDEQTYFTFSYSPVRDEAGAVAGMFCSAIETTAHVAAETALAEREEELQALTDNLPVLLSYVDADRRYRFMNRTYETWFPHPRSDLLGRRVADVIGPQAYAVVAPHMDRALGGQTATFEQVMPYKEGGHRHVEVEYVPRVDDAGQVLGFYALVQDVTARKTAEAALRESDARFRLMADHAPVKMWVTDPSGHCTYLNARWYEYTGQTPGAGEGFGWLDCVHPEDRPIAEAAFLEANAEQRNYQIDFRVRRADGVYRWCLDTAAARFTEAGDYLGYIGSVVDIDDRKTAAQALERRVAEQTAERNRVWEMSRDLFAIIGFDGRMKAINPAWETTLGHDTAELLAMDISQQVHPDDHAAVEAMMQTLLRGEAISRFEDRLLHADGAWRWISWTLVPEGEVFYAVGRDVTAEREAAAELEQAQEALRQSQKMEAMGQLTGGVAHDFNNLLTPIVGSLDMLQRQGLGGQREQRLIAGALQSADRARTLVQRLLAFARRQPLQATAVDVSRLVAGMAELVASTSGPQVRLVVEAPEGLPAALADPNQLEMALLNLGVNARDAMPGGGTLTISVALEQADAVPAGPAHRPALRPGAYIRLTVADTGVGMDEATRRRAIEPFFSTKGIGKGTGL